MGLHPMYDDPEKLQKKIDRYFEKHGTKEDPPLIDDMAQYLGFSSYQSLRRYEDKDDFVHIIQAAKTKCGIILNKLGLKNELNTRLVGLNISANHGINEKTSHEINANVNSTIGVSPELAEMLNEYRQKRTPETDN